MSLCLHALSSFQRTGYFGRVHRNNSTLFLSAEAPTDRPFPSVLGEPFEVTTTFYLGQAFFRCSSQRLNNASGLVPLGPRFLAGFETGGGREHLGCSPFPVSSWPFGQRSLGHPDLASVRRTFQSYDWNFLLVNTLAQHFLETPSSRVVSRDGFLETLAASRLLQGKKIAPGLPFGSVSLHRPKPLVAVSGMVSGLARRSIHPTDRSARCQLGVGS